MMVNRNWRIIGLVALAMGLAAGGLRGTDQAPPPVSPVKPDPPAPAVPCSVDYLGVSSCASVACHGGPMSSPLKWQSSYTVWVTKDRHARAYNVLWETRSKDIVRLLDGGDNPQPWNDARCLACHSLHGGIADLAIASDGVSCEACHGAASGWLAPHTTVAWKTLPPAKKYAAPFRLQDTKDTTSRAKICIDCHVGQSNPNDPSPKDVTHRLIAAGHPRLAFEFSAYMANMPPHWNTAVDQDTKSEASAWVVGQALSAQAAMNLRAAHAAHGSLEFADYDCYACHHELESESWRRMQAEPRPERHAAPGELRLGTWYTGMVQRVQPLAGLDPKPATAPETAKALQTWIDRQDSAGLRQIMAAIATQGADALHWDDATQCYLALRALNNTRDDPASRGGESSDADKRIRDSIKLLSQDLTFPKASNSPRNYDPKQFQNEMRNLVELLNVKSK